MYLVTKLWWKSPENCQLERNILKTDFQDVLIENLHSQPVQDQVGCRGSGVGVGLVSTETKSAGRNKARKYLQS